MEEFCIERDEHRVTVTGWIDPEKLLKKLKKATRMTVEIVCENEKEESCDESNDESVELVPQQFEPKYSPNCMKSEALMIFSDENPNACVIM